MARFWDKVLCCERDETGICTAAIREIRDRLMGRGDRGSDRMVGRAMGRVWGSIVDLSFAATGTQVFAVPAGQRLGDIRRSLGFKLVLNYGVGPAAWGNFIAVSATWLQLPFHELQWLVEVMYQDVGLVDPATEANRLVSLAEMGAWV